MGLFDKKTKKVEFEKGSIYKSIGEYDVYYPDTEESMTKVTDLLQSSNKSESNGQTQIDFSDDMTLELFDILTNVNMTKDRWEKNKVKMEFRLRIVANYIQDVLMDTIELIKSEIETTNSREKLGIQDSVDKAVELSEKEIRKQELLKQLEELN